ncbi:unnamed protein product, partial [Trichogramma brassicae]
MHWMKLAEAFQKTTSGDKFLIFDSKHTEEILLKDEAGLFNEEEFGDLKPKWNVFFLTDFS